MRISWIIGIFLVSTSIVSGCSVDWNDEKDKKISSLENKLLALEEKLDAKSKESESKSLSNDWLCFSKWEEYKKNSKNRSAITSIFYSSILDTCVAEMNFDGERPPTTEDWNLFSKVIVNILTWESLWDLSYWDLSWFESQWFLPKECDRQFEPWNNADELNLLLSTEDNTLANKIYSAEFQYENCLSYIKWKWMVKIKAFRNSEEYRPTFIDPPINY